MPRVFLSYYRDEGGVHHKYSLDSLVELLARSLEEAANVKCIIDNQCSDSRGEHKQRPIPDSWYTEMAQQIRDADFVLIFPTHAYGLRAHFHEKTGVSSDGQLLLTLHMALLM